MSKEDDIIIEARKYIGTPFFFKGRSRGGLDCAGLATLAINVYIRNYNFTNYTINPNPKIIKKELLRIANNVNNLRSGDLLLIDLYGLPQHIALYTSNNTIIHTYKGIGKVVEEKYTYYWKNKVDSIYRIKEELKCL